jgi:hypothetical protein
MFPLAVFRENRIYTNDADFGQIQADRQLPFRNIPELSRRYGANSLHCFPLVDVIALFRATTN